MNVQILRGLTQQCQPSLEELKKTLKGAVSMDHNLKDRGETIDILEYIQKMEDWPPEQQF